ncbi:MFS transporter [Rhizobium bangladeshense]|uniref:MFS transporter n=1 Tax=Rhizobium bangladeshense TaxID=1138189 RepID=UPI0007E5B425|nr:MFS transporter [Rhizobium bangladeshense]
MSQLLLVFGPLTSGRTTSRPYLIVAALLLASFVVGFDTRVFAVGLPDIRGAYSLGADEASWLSTIANAPQILVASAVAWLVTVFGIRRVMIPSALAYAAISFTIPEVTGGTSLFILHACRGLLLGVFIPATLMAIFRNLPTKYWLIGIALYALRVPLSQSLGFVLVGIYGDYLGWQWLYWQDVIVAPIIALLLIVAAPREDTNIGLLEKADWGGMLLLGSSMTLLYIGLDQGNRLDWFQSGVVTSLLAGGAVLAACFFINESLVERPWAHASVILSRNIGIGYAVIICFSLCSAGGSIAVPGFLQNVGGLRPVAISYLYFIAAVIPVFLFTGVAVVFQRRVDARLCIIIGLSMMGVGALFGSQLTNVWSPSNFLLTVLFYTAGQSFAFFSTVVYLIANSDPARSTAVSAYIQVIRLGSVELATSLMTTWLRQREQFHSNVLGHRITAASPELHAWTAKAATLLDNSARSGLEVLSVAATQIRAQAYVLAYADILMLSFWSAVAGLALVSLMGAMPFGPLHPDFTHEQSSRRPR